MLHQGIRHDAHPRVSEAVDWRIEGDFTSPGFQNDNPVQQVQSDRDHSAGTMFGFLDRWRAEDKYRGPIGDNDIMSESNSVQRGDMGGIGKIFSDFLTRGASGSDEREVEHARAEYAVSHVDFDEMMEIVLGQLRETLEDFDFETEDVRGVVENLNNRVNSLIDQ
jgi:hypothetical protein